MPATKNLIASRAAARIEDAPLYAGFTALAAARAVSDSGDAEAMAERAEIEQRLRRALEAQRLARLLNN